MRTPLLERMSTSDAKLSHVCSHQIWDDSTKEHMCRLEKGGEKSIAGRRK